MKNCVALLTGAGKPNGIGRALVEGALARGAKKVYATARKLSQLDDLVAQYPDQVVPLELDVTDRSQIAKIAEIAADTQVLINNAGVAGPNSCIHDYNEDLARLEMEVNFFAPLHLINAFAPRLIQNGSGAIVNVVSIAGLYPSPRNTTYAASKAACYSLTEALRIEMLRGGHNIPVFGVYPGPIDTAMTGSLNVQKESPANLANRVFDQMEQGVLDITTDALSDHFQVYLQKDPRPIQAVKEFFS